MNAPPARHVFKLGRDVDLKCVVTAIQCDHGAIALAQKLTRAQLLAWVQKQTSAGHTVHTVYEACGFGYTLHHALIAAGAQSIVTTPMQLSPERTLQQRGAKVWAHRPALEQGGAGAAGGGGVAALEMTAALARAGEISEEVPTRHLAQKEAGRGPGPATGHRPVAVEDGPLHA